jgi:two-component system chemotaxis sensor kinase CheA
VAFGVEEVLSVEEVLVKPLKKPLIRVCNILGATTLASGKIVPILNVHDLTRAVKQAKAAPPPVAPKTQEEQKPQRQQKILLAEDSMTSRMLLKGILETAGYVVQTAVDGIEALTLLKTEHFDLIISDVEMPRMNGFDLITEIRKDRRLSEKPVVLVTALATREDRERGIDVGANAYIVKSSFEQSNLLDTVRRLI